jgi:hypothetical protein
MSISTTFPVNFSKPTRALPLCIQLTLFAIILIFATRASSETSWTNVTAAEYSLGEFENLNLGPNESIRSGTSHSPESYDLAYVVNRTPFCALATVTAIRYECISRRHTGAQSLAIIQFQVEELYWGKPAESVVFETLVSREEDCRIIYDTPQHTGFELGEEFLVLGANGKQTNYVKRFGLLRLVDGLFTAENNQSWPREIATDLILSRQRTNSPKPQNEKMKK